MVGQQDFQQRHTPTIRGVAMANTHFGGIAQAFGFVGSVTAAAGTGDIVLGGIGQYVQFFTYPIKIHNLEIIQSKIWKYSN